MPSRRPPPPGQASLDFAEYSAVTGGRGSSWDSREKAELRASKQARGLGNALSMMSSASIEEYGLVSIRSKSEAHGQLEYVYGKSISQLDCFQVRAGHFKPMTSRLPPVSSSHCFLFIRLQQQLLYGFGYARLLAMPQSAASQMQVIDVEIRPCYTTSGQETLLRANRASSRGIFLSASHISSVRSSYEFIIWTQASLSR